MSVLVAYATKHGATRLIAERIGDMLRAHGLEADILPMKDVANVDMYEAFVIGGAVYFGSWLKDVTTFVDHHKVTLAERPVWLFSSGPLGTETTQDSTPKQLESVTQAIRPHDHRIFYGALDHTRFDLPERLLWALPASRKLLIEGDFRDWPEIETWAVSIANQLKRESVGSVQTRNSDESPLARSTRWDAAR